MIDSHNCNVVIHYQHLNYTLITLSNHFDIKTPISFGVNVFLTTLWNEMIYFASDANIINKACKNEFILFFKKCEG